MPPLRENNGYIAPMLIGVTLWIIALILTVTGLVSVLRYRVVVGAGLIVTGLTLGLLSSGYLG
ncbi:hypothetical protein EV644_12483 [Kribbella orskensis]|uniref:DUF2530 domain-containing protein n=1 Tax=Kribbella orskensis TaxID=2512216 RepID=A0ABY2BA19_9ACTN|nr:MULTISPECIES: hypothetical protein [Kribbella]TCN32724.1 hypothetical protein EV642_12616 [Kribbella sp. VKM Ac-2500]TCO12959.1 hypothetical protein EV644_12483 [Kribbella orskensis]